MKAVEAFPKDTTVRRAGLAAIVGIVEYGGGVPRTAAHEGQNHEDNQSSTTGAGGAGHDPCSTESAAVANRLRTLGGVTFVAAWLQVVTAPAWAWGGIGYESGSSLSEKDKCIVLLSACKAATLLCRNSTMNQDRLANMGACEALTRAVAMSGCNDRKDGAGNTCVASKEEASLSLEPLTDYHDSITSMRMEAQVWAARGIAELAGGHVRQNRCLKLVKAGALCALFAAMSKRPFERQLQRAGCLTLGDIAVASSKPKYLHNLGRKGGAKAVMLALNACADDVDVTRAGLLAIAKLTVSAENRRLLGKAGACPLVSRVLANFAENPNVAEEGCRAVAGLATFSGFNRTALGHGGAAEAVADALRNHPSQSGVQRWGLTAIATLVADADPSCNTTRITDAKGLVLVSRALARFSHDLYVQTEGLRAFAKVATVGPEGVDAAWKAGALVPTIRALGLHPDDGDVQHWGMATMRAMTSTAEACLAWREVGAPEAVVRTLRTFGEEGLGRKFRHDGENGSTASGTRACTSDKLLAIQFQACACVLHLADSPDGRGRLVREGAGSALVDMMTYNIQNAAVQRGALAALAEMSTSGAENRRCLGRYKGGVPMAVVSALKNFPNDNRVRCEGVLTIQNLSSAVGGARAMIKAGVAPVLITLLRNALEINTAAATVTATSTPREKRGAPAVARKECRQWGRGVAEGGNVERDGERLLLLTYIM